MTLQDNFAIQTKDAILLAGLHRTRGLEILDHAETGGNDPARLSARATVKLADKAISIFREALAILPDLKSALVAKRIGDVRMLECDFAFIATRRLVPVIR